MRILLVEDNDEIATLVAKGLERSGLPCDRVSSVEEAKNYLESAQYSLIVLDLGLPDEDGLVLLRDIRAQKMSIPILITTARSSLMDRVGGLKSGADDYLIKPFALEELVARAEALLRRPHVLEERTISAGNLTMNLRDKTLAVQEQPFVLNARELTLLEILMRRSGRVVTKKLIEDEIFGSAGEVSSNAIEVYMHRLRKQLVEAAASVEIHTVRGIGYLLAETK